MSTRIVETSTLAIEVEVVGDGPRTVLLLHGWPDAPVGWADVRDGLLADGHRVVVPALRGSGGTRFLDEDTVRDGTGTAVAADALALVDALGIERFDVVGHDWGARAAYQLATIAPERVTSVTALALAYQPRAAFAVPDFGQARRFWYQWLMFVDAGARAIADDPSGFAREQWATWSPPGWWSDADFHEAAASFDNPDWVAITLSAYRTRFDPDAPLDPALGSLREVVGASEHVAVPTLLVQGGADDCDPPALSEGLDQHFDRYQRVVLDSVGHFPHREAPDEVLALVRRHLAETGGAR